MKNIKAKLLTTLCITFSVASILFKAEYVQASDIAKVDSQKIWAIKFNTPLDSNVEVLNRIKVIGSDGQEVTVSKQVTGDEKELDILPPSGGYEEGKEYTLSISKDIRSKSGKNLKQDYEKKFIIASSTNNLNTEDLNSKPAPQTDTFKPVTGDVNLTILDGERFILPKTISIANSNGIKTEESVTWDTEHMDIKTGMYIVKGKVQGSDKAATAVINVSCKGDYFIKYSDFQDVNGDDKGEIIETICKKGSGETSNQYSDIQVLIKDAKDGRILNTIKPNSNGYIDNPVFKDFDKDGSLDVLLTLPSDSHYTQEGHEIYSLKGDKLAVLYSNETKNGIEDPSTFMKTFFTVNKRLRIYAKNYNMNSYFNLSSLNFDNTQPILANNNINLIGYEPAGNGFNDTQDDLKVRYGIPINESENAVEVDIIYSFDAKTNIWVFKSIEAKKLIDKVIDITNVIIPEIDSYKLIPYSSDTWLGGSPAETTVDNGTIPDEILDAECYANDLYHVTRDKYRGYIKDWKICTYLFDVHTGVLYKGTIGYKFTVDSYLP